MVVGTLYLTAYIRGMQQGNKPNWDRGMKMEPNCLINWEINYLKKKVAMNCQQVGKTIGSI